MSTLSGGWVGRALAGGRYRVSTQLGEGGMGTVYQAHDRHLDCDVVIKVPRVDLLSGDADFAARFGREVRSLVRLAHAHIVKVLDVGEYEGVPFAVLQYLGGGSLRERPALAPGASSSDLALQLAWLAPVADALDFIHKQGYIHRDVKPDNILFDGHGHVYLGDFGIAKALAAGPQATEATFQTGAGLVLGTPQYMAPEVILGKAFDGRADQYALAVTVYELVCARVPFSGPTPAAVVVQQTTQPPPPPQQWVPALPAGLSRALLRGLAKEPSQRFADCRAFAAAVAASLDVNVPIPTPVRSQPVAPLRRAASTPPPSRPTPGPRRSAPVPPLVSPPDSNAGQMNYPCPSCGTVFLLPPQPAGKRLRCRHCGNDFQVPKEGKLPSSDPPSKRRKTDPVPSQAKVPTAPTPLARTEPILDALPAEPEMLLDALPATAPGGRYPCPACRQVLGVPERSWGRSVRCHHCRTRFMLPDRPPAPRPRTTDQTAPLPRRGRGGILLAVGGGALLLVIVGLGLLGWAYGDGGAGHCRRCETYLRDGEFSKAVDEATSALDVDHKLVKAYALRGGAYTRLGQFDRAIADCKDALRLDPSSALAHAYLGDAYGNLGDTDKAIEECSEAIKLDDRLTVAYVARSNAYGDQGDLDDAIRDAKKAIEMDPRLGLPHAYLGVHLARQGKYAEGLKEFDQAVVLSPKDPEVYNSRGVAHDSNNQHALALSDFDKAIELNAGCAAYFSNRAGCNLALGNKDRALKDVTEALRLSPNSAPAHMAQGEYYVDLKDYPQAVASFTRAIALNPKMAGAYYAKGQALFYQDDPEQALTVLNQGIANCPRSDDLYIMRALVYLREQGVPESAITDLNEAIRLQGSRSGTYVLRAEAYTDKKQFDEAIADCNRAIALDANNAAAYAERGWCQFARWMEGDLTNVADADVNRALQDSARSIELDRELALGYRTRALVTLIDLKRAQGNKVDLNNPRAVGIAGRLLNDMTRARELEPETAYSHFFQGMLSTLGGKKEEGDAEFKQAIDLEPNLQKIYNPEATE